MKVQFIFALLFTYTLSDCFTDNCTSTVATAGDVTTRLPDPICGIDGLTYINYCHIVNCFSMTYFVADVATPLATGLEVLAYTGVCKCNCTAQPMNKVCGADGLMYRNKCALVCSGVPEGNRCQSRNCNCRGLYDIVCGVDGRNYTSACKAGCVGIAVAYNSRCMT